MDFDELRNSQIFTHSLVRYHDGKSRMMDLDGISQKLGYFLIFESKTFSSDMIEVKLMPFTVYSELKNQLPRCDIYIIGTESNTRMDDDDTIYYISIEKARRLKQDNSQAIRSICIHRNQMTPVTRGEFNYFMNRQLDLKGDPFYDPKEAVLKMSERYR
jgi:hypothetical protein